MIKVNNNCKEIMKNLNIKTAYDSDMDSYSDTYDTSKNPYRVELIYVGKIARQYYDINAIKINKCKNEMDRLCESNMFTIRIMTDPSLSQDALFTLPYGDMTIDISSYKDGNFTVIRYIIKVIEEEHKPCDTLNQLNTSIRSKDISLNDIATLSLSFGYEDMKKYTIISILPLNSTGGCVLYLMDCTDKVNLFAPQVHGLTWNDILSEDNFFYDYIKDAPLRLEIIVPGGYNSKTLQITDIIEEDGEFIIKYDI